MKFADKLMELKKKHFKWGNKLGKETATWSPT